MAKPDAPLDSVMQSLFKQMFGWPDELVRQAAERATPAKFPHYQIGVRLMARHDFRSAIAAFQRELQDHLYHADSFRQIAMCSTLNEQWEQAIAGWSALIALRPNFAFAYSERGRCYAKAGQKDAAIRDLHRSLEMVPESDFARQILAGLEKDEQPSER